MMNTTNVSTVWLELLRAQRPLRYAEIAERLPEMTHNHRAVSLNVAFRLGYLERSGGIRKYQYSVTPRCVVPHGIPLHELLEATN